VAELDQIRERIRWLGLTSTRAAMYNLAGRKIDELIQAGFDREVSPKGQRWRQSAAAARENRKTLHDTGALQTGIRWKADSRRVEVKTTGAASRYAGYQQRGTSRSPARPFLPEGGANLPRGYDRAIRRVLEGYIRSRFP